MHLASSMGFLAMNTVFYQPDVQEERAGIVVANEHLLRFTVSNYIRVTQKSRKTNKEIKHPFR